MHCPIPDSNRGIVSTANKFVVRRRKTQSMNGLLIVRIYGLDGGNTGTPVFNISTCITGEQKIVVV